MYVDAIFNRDTDEILVAERIDGQRRLISIPAVHRAYYPDSSRGNYESIFGDKLAKIESTNYSKFSRELSQRAKGLTLFESDINPIFRCLEENYLGQESPDLNICFLDIETDFDPERGFADPWNPFSAITAVTICHSNDGRLITLVLKPKRINLKTNKEYITLDEGNEIVSKFEDTFLFTDEAELLDTFLTLIEDADVLTGWNSTGYDIPYLVNRIERILGKKDTRRFCLWDQKPRVRKYEKFKKEQKTYDLVGRVHLDYLELYMKHCPQQLHSYRLDFVGEIEVKENKVPYEGSLDELYHKDFEKFIAYNRQDVALLVKIDKKRKFIDLANQIAHTNAVLLKTTTGSVALIDQAITLEAHSKGLIVPNRNRDFDEDKDIVSLDIVGDEEDDDDDDAKAAVGAYVANPKKGLHSYIGAVDINSLYPSTIRSLNISTETLFGQIRLDRTYKEVENRVKNHKELGIKKAEAWDGIFAAFEYDSVFNKTDDILTLDLVNGDTLQLTGSELYDFVFDPQNKLVISANGTLFTRTREGIIPSLLSRWYSERKSMQKDEKLYGSMAHGVEIKNDELLKQLNEILPIESIGITPEYNTKELEEHVKKNNIEAICEFVLNHNLYLHGQIIIPSPDEKKKWKALSEFWYMRQQARKILLNSLYGALLNESCKFYDQRMGQSVTLTGRSIAKHMGGNVHKVFTGIEDYLGNTVIYQDTDSCFSETIIRTTFGDMTVEALFDYCSIKWGNGEKEYSVNDKIKVLSYDPKTETAQYMPINYVYRHKVSKARLKITDVFGNEIIVTGDHSVMVERNGILIEVKPRDILVDDMLISVVDKQTNIVKSKIAKIEQLDDFDDEYVYDIGIKGDTPYFFGNDILVHNSAYFSAEKCLDTEYFKNKFPWFTPTKDNYIKLYDSAADEVNATFPEFMDSHFNTSIENGKIIAAGREIVASRALFIKKKKYACLIYDKEGERYDLDGKPGKIKAMGLDLKRADTPKLMQVFLESILMDLLTGSEKEHIFERIIKFREEFKSLKPWQMGTPRKVNGISGYKERIDAVSMAATNVMVLKVKEKKITVPGHVRASINWNNLVEMNKDHYSQPITDGSKVIVCTLKPNVMNLKSIAYPIDQTTLPDWYKELPFDTEEMENIIIDKKIKNLLEVLGWNLQESKDDTTFNDFFSFGEE